MNNGHLKLIDNSSYPKKFKSHVTEESKSALFKFLESHYDDINKKVETGKDELIYPYDYSSGQQYEHNTSDDFIKNFTGTKSEKFSFQTGNVIGYAKKENYALEIGSRFGDNFLKYMIADAHGFREVKNLGEQNHEDGYDWLLAYLWNIKLKKAYRLGLPKDYVTRNERTSRIRGTIDPVDYFLNKSTGKYLCSYREHSYGNSAVSLFTHAYKMTRRYSFSHDTWDIYQVLLTANQGKKKISPKELLKTKHFQNPFYSDYNPLIDLSKKIINHQGSNFGYEDEANAFFFDISMLFEYFIHRLLKKEGISPEIKPVNSDKKDASKIPYYTLPTGGSKKYGHGLEPDIVIEKNDDLYIFDVKYKKFNFEEGVERDDLFQLHTYISQYANYGKIKGCGFIYPLKENETSIIPKNMKIKWPKENISFHIFFLKIPNNSSNNFYSLIEKQCKEFIKSFCETIDI